MSKLPTQTQIRKRALLALSDQLEHDLTYGEEKYLFDLVEWESLTHNMKMAYQDKMEAAITKLISDLRGGRIK